jgi:hypothetical protein
MQILYKLLDKAALEGTMLYHPKCTEGKLTNLCFLRRVVHFLEW